MQSRFDSSFRFNGGRLNVVQGPLRTRRGSRARCFHFLKRYSMMWKIWKKTFIRRFFLVFVEGVTRFYIEIKSSTFFVFCPSFRWWNQWLICIPNGSTPKTHLRRYHFEYGRKLIKNQTKIDWSTGPPHVAGPVAPKQTFRLGETVKLDCPIRGVPAPILEWLKVSALLLSFV